jgi:signal transduction histidine kinase/CheY-like chemotaxis protein
MTMNQIARANAATLVACFPGLLTNPPALGEPEATRADSILQIDDRSYNFRRTPLAASGQTPYGFIWQLTDVTDQQRAEADLRRAKEIAEETSAAKSRFVANVSHELRTPLTGVVGLSELLQKTPLTSRQQEYLRGIQQCSQTLLRLINDVLDMSKLDAEAMTIANEGVDLMELVDEVAQIHRHLASEKNVKIVTASQSAQGATVLVDPLRLSQVLHNLLGNAVKFTAEGSITVTVERTEPGWFEIAVSDTGVGIPREKLDSVFEAFEQADDSTTRNFGGTGLGLTITRRLVERMGGTIAVESQVGTGTTMRVRVPMTETVLTVDPLPAEPIPTGIRILLVEDNPVNTMVISEQLLELGCRVEHAANGQAAVTTFASQDFDLVLMDIQMPVMDGLTAARTIRAEFPDRPTRIVALTANAMEEERQRAAAAGMNGFITKPVRTDELDEILRTVSVRNVI